VREMTNFEIALCPIQPYWISARGRRGRRSIKIQLYFVNEASFCDVYLTQSIARRWNCSLETDQSRIPQTLPLILAVYLDWAHKPTMHGHNNLTRRQIERARFLSCPVSAYQGSLTLLLHRIRLALHPAGLLHPKPGRCTTSLVTDRRVS
jgi:hypothetical protein